MPASDSSRVAFLSNDGQWSDRERRWIPSGSVFYRCLIPADSVGGWFGKPRFNPVDGFGIDDGADGIYGFDTIVLKLMWDRQYLTQMRLAKALGQRVAIDIDDHFEEVHATNAAADLFAQNPRALDTYRTMIEEADFLTVSTPVLRDFYAARGKDVRLARNMIDPRMFTPRPAIDGKPVIGWVGATAYRSGDLETLSGWLPSYLQERGLLFQHSGWHEDFPVAADIIGIPHDRCLIHPVVPITRLARLYDFDIGLVPLNDVPFNRAKSNLKGLEYAASGIPFVAQALPEYVRLAEEGAGTVVDGPEGWMEALDALSSLEARVEAARAAHGAVLRLYDYRQHPEVWQEALR